MRRILIPIVTIARLGGIGSSSGGSGSSSIITFSSSNINTTTTNILLLMLSNGNASFRNPGLKGRRTTRRELSAGIEGFQCV